eukprot:625829_1
MMEYSSIIAIAYFSMNFVFLIALGVSVYKQGGHKIKSKSYLKDIWNQRKIYAPIIIHFYDTATDIGVILHWYQLMQKENDPNKGIHYKSVNMNVFFWSGITCLIVYRFCWLCYLFLKWFIDGEFVWYFVVLVLCDLYIFLPVYDSFSRAQDTITANAKKRGKNVETQKTAQEEQKENNASESLPEEEIEPTSFQYYVQISESIIEALPQIILQSVFIIRSENDPVLRKGSNDSNVFLLIFSVIGSLLSISNKYVWNDTSYVITIAQSLKPRLEFPGCIQHWYVIRTLWRLCIKYYVKILYLCVNLGSDGWRMASYLDWCRMGMLEYREMHRV